MKAKKKSKSEAKVREKSSEKSDEKAVQKWRLVTREQLSTLMGVHPDTITDNVRHGMPIVARGGHGKEGAYDAVACLAWQRQRIGKNAKENAQTRLIELQADIKTLELQLETGKLMVREDVVREVQAFGKGLQAMIRALPRRAVQGGVPPEFESVIADVCRDVLTEISQWQAAKDLPQDGRAA